MKKICLQFTNGLSFAEGVRDILSPLAGEYEFVESSTPDYVIFGPYGNAIPPAGGPVRIGYFCENMRPDLSICDWAFGMSYEEEVGDPRYMRIQWHGIDPDDLVKRDRDRPEDLLGKKTRFCNFIYDNPVPYRERFFRELSKYKQVDAPGRSMKNIPTIDTDPGADRWQAKCRFLGQYKFTIAFENYSYPGYNSEKLYHSMLADSLPIYFGNPDIGRHYNTRSFVNGHQYVRSLCKPLLGPLERWAQPPFVPTLRRTDLAGRLMRRLKGEARNAKMYLQCFDYEQLVEEVIRIDRDDDLYLSYAAQPWFAGNRPPSNEGVLARWREIFSGPAARQGSAQ